MASYFRFLVDNDLNNACKCATTRTHCKHWTKWLQQQSTNLIRSYCITDTESHLQRTLRQLSDRCWWLLHFLHYFSTDTFFKTMMMITSAITMTVWLLAQSEKNGKRRSSSSAALNKMSILGDSKTNRRKKERMNEWRQTVREKERRSSSSNTRWRNSCKQNV